MTEPDWLAVTDPTPLVAYVRGRTIGRKLATAAIALCRLDRDLMAERRFSRKAVEWSEQVTEGEIASDDPGGMDPGACYLMGAAANRCMAVAGLAADGDLVRAHEYFAEVVELLTDEASTRRLKRMAEVCRDIFGNPFRSVPFSPAWRTEAAVGLARHMYRCRKFSAMPILADALQDAGCEDEQLLGHCRGTGPHVRGCWVIDLVLDNQQRGRAEPLSPPTALNRNEDSGSGG